MSSFRIDRQYVSFVTAETRPVYATGQLPQTSAYFSSTDAVGADEHTQVTQQHYAEIFETIQKEADEKATLILANAVSEADAIVSKAKNEAGEIVDKAKMIAESVLEDARQMGYSEGQKNAEAHADAKKSKDAIELQQLVDKLHKDYADLVDGMRAGIISLVIDIVKKVINFRLNDSEEIFLSIINNAIEQLKQTGEVIIHVGSEDYARYFGKAPAEKNIHAGKAKVIVIEEQGYLPGDLVVESEGEVMDFSVGRQIERIESAFIKEGE